MINKELQIQKDLFD